MLHFNVFRSKRSAAQSGETDAEANRKRTLQGAAPFTINADIKYETKTETISLERLH